MRLTLSISSLFCVALAAPVAAQQQPFPGTGAYSLNSAAPQVEIIRSYQDTADKPGNSRELVLAQLNRVCASRYHSDRDRCDRAWRIINRAHAELLARRLAETPAAAPRP